MIGHSRNLSFLCSNEAAGCCVVVDTATRVVSSFPRSYGLLFE